jgi:hypothetical protein
MCAETPALAGFEVQLSSSAWPTGDGPVHTEEDPCHHGEDLDIHTDLATVPSEGKYLCEDCEWPDGAQEALESGNQY